MPKHNHISELKNSLTNILTALQRKKMTFSGKYNINSINDGINALENIQSVSIDSLQGDNIQCDDLQFLAQLIKLERLFTNSPTLRVHPFPNFREIINPAALIYAEIDLQLEDLENKAKNLLDGGHLLESSKTINMIFLLRKLNRVYFIKGKIDYTTYQERSLAIIERERPELERYFGYKQIFVNLLRLIASLGTESLLDEVCTENFLFFKQPEHHTKRPNVLDEAIPSVALKKKE